MMHGLIMISMSHIATVLGEKGRRNPTPPPCSETRRDSILCIFIIKVELIRTSRFTCQGPSRSASDSGKPQDVQYVGYDLRPILNGTRRTPADWGPGVVSGGLGEPLTIDE